MKQQSTITSPLCVWRRLTVGQLHQICSETQTKIKVRSSEISVLSEPKEECLKTSASKHEAAKHHHITAVCLAAAHSRPPPSNLFRKSNIYSKLRFLKFQCAQNQKKSTQPPHEAVKHHHIIAVCLAVAHSRPAPPKMFRKSNKYSKF